MKRTLQDTRLSTSAPSANISYDHLDPQNSTDTYKIQSWFVEKSSRLGGGIRGQVRVPCETISASEACRPCVQAPIFQLTDDSAKVSTLLEQLAPRMAPFWHRWQLKRVKIETMLPHHAVSQETGSRIVHLETYLRGGHDLDVGTMLANLATTSWTEGTVITQNTDYSLKSCEIVPRPRPVRQVPMRSDTNVAGPYRDNLHITTPYQLVPRRLWDLVNNRVVDIDTFAKRGTHGEIIRVRMPPGGYWAISHSWTSDMETWMTPINNYRWPVPLPKGVKLEDIRLEALRVGAVYIWLDVLCLRQRMDERSTSLTGGESCQEVNREERLAEWSIDVPTIGNNYRQATHVLRYFNGLGRKLKLTGWDDARHWINRAWTLQESRPEHIMVNACLPEGMYFPLQAEVDIAGQKRTIRQVLYPLMNMIEDAEAQYVLHTSMLERAGGFFERLPWWSVLIQLVDNNIFFRGMTTLAVIQNLCGSIASAAVYAGRTLRMLPHVWMDPKATFRGIDIPKWLLKECAKFVAGKVVKMVLRKILPFTKWVFEPVGRELVHKVPVPGSFAEFFNIMFHDMKSLLTMDPEAIIEAIMGAIIEPWLEMRLCGPGVTHNGWASRIDRAVAGLVMAEILFACVVQFIRVAYLALAINAKIPGNRSQARTQGAHAVSKSSQYCSILALAHEMSRRHASNELDKIAGLGYLMKCPQLPLYCENQPTEEAWLHLVSHLPYSGKLELLFNFPHVRDSQQDGPGAWIPEWGQVTSLAPEAEFKLQRPTWPPRWFIEQQRVPKLLVSLSHSTVFDVTSRALFVPCCGRVMIARCIASACDSAGNHERGNYMVHIASKNGDLAHPFFAQCIGTRIPSR